MTWAEQELDGAPMSDARLSRRWVKLVTRLAESPLAGIPQACGELGGDARGEPFPVHYNKLDSQDIVRTGMPHAGVSDRKLRSGR